MAPAVASALQIFDDVVHTPGFQSAALGAVEPWSKPALHRGAAEGATALARAEHVLGRVASTAMRDAFDQIAAAVPFRAFLLVGLEDARPEEQPIPAPHHHAVIERPAQFRRRRAVLNWRERREVGADRQQVVADHLGEVGIGERGVVERTVAPYAVTQGAIELLVAPGAEAGIAIRRQIGRIDPAERGVDLFSPGERLCRIGSVATGAIGRLGQRLAARDGLSRGLGLRLAKAERSAQKYDRENRSHCSIWSLRRLVCPRDIIARNHARDDVMSFRDGTPQRHKAKPVGTLSGTKLRFGNAGLHCLDLWCAGFGKRHRLIPVLF